MTETEHKSLDQPEQWKLIAKYQKSKHLFKVDMNCDDDMGLFFEWLKNYEK